MQVIEVPHFGDDGSIITTTKVNPEEAQVLLQFALNFLVSAGITMQQIADHAETCRPEQLDD